MSQAISASSYVHNAWSQERVLPEKIEALSSKDLVSFEDIADAMGGDDKAIFQQMKTCAKNGEYEIVLIQAYDGDAVNEGDNVWVPGSNLEQFYFDRLVLRSR